MRRTSILLASFLAGAWAATAPAWAESFIPADRTAIDLVKAHVTDGYVTVARSIAYAERASRGAFAFVGYRVEHVPGEAFKHVRICYRLGIDPPLCGVEYLVGVNPPHVEPSDRSIGLGRDLEHGPRAFLRALARDASLQRQPEMLRRIHAALEPYNPYDWR